MSDHLRNIQEDVGLLVEQLNDRRAKTLVSFLSALLPKAPKLSREGLTQYLTGIDPEIEGYPFDSLRVLVPEEYSGTWDLISDAEDRQTMDRLLDGGCYEQNEISTLRGVCLVTHIVTGMSIREMLTYMRDALAKQAIFGAGEFHYDLPPAWTADMDRKKITTLLMYGHQSGTTGQTGPDHRLQTAIAYFERNPDPCLLADKLMNSEGLKGLSEMLKRVLS